MNILFYLEPLIIQDNPLVYCAWLPLWTRLIRTMKIKIIDVYFKMIVGQAVYSVISQFDMPEYVDVIPISFESLTEKFNFSAMDASIAWYRGKYTKNQMKYTSRLFAEELDDWIPNVIISSSHVPFLKKIYPKAVALYFEVGMTSRPPFPISFYLDPEGLYKFSFLAKKADVINDEPIDLAMSKLLEKYRHLFMSMIDSKNIFSRFAESHINKFRYVILLPLQTDGFWFQGNCDFSSMFQFVHKLLSTIDPQIGVIVTPHPINSWFTDEIVRYFEECFPNFLYSPDILQVSSSSQYLLQHIDAVLSVSSMVGLQALIWKKKLFSIGETQLKVGAEYCFKPDLSDIEKLPELLKRPTTNKDNVLFWLLTHFYIPEFYFYDPVWISKFITRLVQANTYGNISLDTFPLIDKPENVFSHILNGAIPDIPRYRGRELETHYYTFEEKIAEFQKSYEMVRGIERKYDEEILFSSGKNNSLLLINGWSNLESWGTWSQGTESDVLISLPANSGKDVKMYGSFHAFINEKHPLQTVDIFINEEKMGNWRFEYGKADPNIEFYIPSKVIEKSSPFTHIRFLLASSISPAALDMSTDTRKLGIGIHFLKFSLEN